MKILTLGPKGTFSHKASINYSKKNNLRGVDIDFRKNILEIFNFVEETKNENVLGIIPVENMLNGSVRETLDLLFRKNVFVVGEVVIPIHHCLACNKKIKKIRQIKKVVSHPQALAQCMKFIRKKGFEKNMV